MVALTFGLAFYYVGPNSPRLRILCSRGILLYVVAALIALAIARRARFRERLRDVFHSPVSPFNLSFFRIFFFSLLFSWSYVPAVFDSSLVVPPLGLDWLLRIIPPSEELALKTTFWLRVFCWFSIFGFFTRSSALLCVILGFFVFGIPTFYGKVSHTAHHFIWFGIVFAVSPAGDFLSVDALIRAWRGFGRRENPTTRPSAKYFRPLIVFWLLFGCIYFFPGFWKLWTSGFDWALNKGLTYLLYDSWYFRIGSAPSWRPDKFSVLMQVGGFAVLAFEIGFIFLVLLPWARAPLAFAALIFHQLNIVFLAIRFSALMHCLVVLIDWEAVRNWLVGRSGASSFCLRVRLGGDRWSRAAALAAPLDFFGLLRFEMGAAAGQLSAHSSARSFHGGAALAAILLRAPLALPAFTAGLLAGSFFDGARIKRERESVGRGLIFSRMENATYALLLLIVVGFGFSKIADAWPFSVYPHFARLKMNSSAARLGFEALDATQNPIPLEDALPVLRWHQSPYGMHYRKGISSFVSREGIPSRELITGVWRILVSEDPRLAQARTVRAYRETISLVPEEWPQNPISKKFIYEIDQKEFNAEPGK